MNILIAGLSRGSAIAVELIAGSVWPDPTFVRVERRVSTSLSEQSPEAIDCDVCMVDVLGLGLSRWSPSREAELNDYLLGRPTIVLVPPGAGGGWLDASGRTTDKTAIRLQHPVSASTLKESLTQLRENLKTLEKRALVPHRDVFLDSDADTGGQIRSDKADRGKGRYGAPVAPNERMTEVPVEQDAAMQLPDPVVGLKRVENGVAALLAACPEIEKNDYLKLVLTCLALDKPSELRLSPQSAVVFCPVDNWVASNISVIIHKRMSQHPLMVQLAQVTELSQEAAIDQAARIFDGGIDKIRPLDTTVWRLVYYIFHAAPPVAQADIRFQLTSFPNFTRMRMQPDLYLQLALVCMRQPQSITSLQRMFPKHAPREITLFAVCAVLSGMASVLSDAPVQPERAIPSVKAPGLDATRKRGFFKALLDKLF